ncbi:MAG: LiaI-LiaF-like domain-containing protein [Patescibacteria group bacterium]
MDERQCCRPKSLVGPVILVGLGVIFLLNNLGRLEWSVWEAILRFWPAILIAFGVELALGRGSVWGSIMGALAVLAVVFVMFAIVSFAPLTAHGPFFGRDYTRSLVTRDVSFPLHGETEAEVEIEAGAGRLELGALAAENDLLAGTIVLARGESLEQDYSGGNGRAHLLLKSRGRYLFPMRGRHWRDRRWDLRLKPGLPLLLRIRTGVSVARLDLAKLKLTRLELENGIGEAEIRLPATGRYEVRMEGGIGKAEVFVPKGLALRIHVIKGLGSVDLPENMVGGDGIYTTPGYEEAKDRADIEVEGGIGEIRFVMEADDQTI